MNESNRLDEDLQKLVSLDASLLPDLQNVRDVDQALERIIAAADRHGISLDAGQLERHLLGSIEADRAAAELSDEEIGEVTGGNGGPPPRVERLRKRIRDLTDQDYEKVRPYL